MFCPTCGTDCQDANFCPECGADLRAFKAQAPTVETAAAVEVERKKYPPLKEPYLWKVRGQTVDLNKLIRTYGMGMRKVGAYAYLSSMGLTKNEAKEILDPLYEYHKNEKVTFVDGLVAGPMVIEQEIERKNERKEKLRQLEESGQVYCPKCLSTSISANKKGFGFVRGAVGAAVGLDVGLIAGGIGSKKVRCTCLKCGYQWMAGKK